jgi:hypothetical protein
MFGGRRSRVPSDGSVPAIVFGSFDDDPSAVEPSGVTRIDTNPARSSLPTAQAPSARGGCISSDIAVDENMNGNQLGQAVGGPSVRTPPTTMVRTDGHVEEAILGGTMTPRAPSGRYLSAEGVTGTSTTAQGAARRVAIGTTTAERSSVEEETLRPRISIDSLQLGANTTSESQQGGTSLDRSRPSTSTNPSVRGAPPTNGAPMRATPYVPVPSPRDPPLAPREINVAGIYAMAKGHSRYKGPEDGQKNQTSYEIQRIQV